MVGLRSGSVKSNCDKLREIAGTLRCRNQIWRSLEERHFCTGETQGTKNHTRWTVVRPPAGTPAHACSSGLETTMGWPVGPGPEGGPWPGGPSSVRARNHTSPSGQPWVLICVENETTLATSVCKLRHHRMEQRPTEPHTGHSTFLLSSGGAGGGYY